MTYRSAIPELADTEYRKHVIHQHHDDLQKPDQKKKSEEPVKTGPTELPSEQPDGIESTVTDGEKGTLPERTGSVSHRLGGERNAFVRRFGSSAQKINRRKKQELKTEAYEE